MSGVSVIKAVPIGNIERGGIFFLYTGGAKCPLLQHKTAAKAFFSLQATNKVFGDAKGPLLQHKKSIPKQQIKYLRGGLINGL